MVKIIAPYSIRGFLWYQGESDDVTGRNILYGNMLTGLISDWRELWAEQLPFIFVQLPGFDKWLMDEATNHFPIIRKCQDLTANQVKDTFMCSISDAGEERDIHPKDKKVVGERLALLARGHVYGEDILCDAPRAVEVKREGNRLFVTFTNAGGGLSVKGDALNALAVCQGDNVLECSARADGEVLEISLSGNAQGAVQVQFAQTPWFIVNLYNSAGIPAIPFECCF